METVGVPQNASLDTVHLRTAGRNEPANHALMSGPSYPLERLKELLEQGFKRWLAAADTVVLACWDLGHIWDAEIYDTVERNRHGSYEMTGRCQRGCQVVRTRFLASDWSPDSNKNTYKYPRGYSPKEFISSRDVGFRVTWEHKAAIRRELARRAKEDAKSGDKSNVVVKFKAPGA